MKTHVAWSGNIAGCVLQPTDSSASQQLVPDKTLRQAANRGPLIPCHRFVVSPFTTEGAVANAAPLRLGWTPPAPTLSAFAPPFEDCGNGGVTIESFAKAAPPINNACPPSKIRQWSGMRLAPKIIRFTKLLIIVRRVCVFASLLHRLRCHRGL